MNTLTLEAYAKVNLSLDVREPRPDGYHNLEMVMQSVSLSDTVTLSRLEGTGIVVRTNRADLPAGEENLAGKAAYCFQEATGRPLDGFVIDIEKRIPVCAGTAGGSSDAAAVLRGLNQLMEAGLSQEQLMQLGEQVGSDVPYCVLGGTALAQGRGEILHPLPSLPPCWILLCKPSFSISTPTLFRILDGQTIRRRPDTYGILGVLGAGLLPALAQGMVNVFEEALSPEECASIQAIKAAMMETGALGTTMSGTGPTVLGIYDNQDKARVGETKLKEQYAEVFLTKPV